MYYNSEVKKLYKLLLKFGFEVRDCKRTNDFIFIDIADPDGLKRTYTLDLRQDNDGEENK